MQAKLAAFCTLAVLEGCAAHPKNIAPVYVSETVYLGQTCGQLRDTLLNVNTALNNTANQQIEARGNDALGIILVGLPVASMTGHDSTAQVGFLKGHAEAIKRAGAAKKCGSLAPIIKWD